ncbi:MAG: S8 family serine peptidase [bacterium]|nr:S8 family serine peptidase [bacterium]
MFRRATACLVLALSVAACGSNPAALNRPGAAPRLSRAAEMARARAVLAMPGAVYADDRVVVRASGFDAAAGPVKGASVADSMDGYEVHMLPDGVTVAQALEAYWADGRVVSASPLMLHAVSDDASVSLPVQPVEPVQPSPTAGINFQQWWLDKVQATEAWRITRGSEEIVVAVLDTGVDYRHPDLLGSVMNGRDFGSRDEDSIDDNGHGTHVAGIIAARGGLTGATGIAPGVKVLGLKVFKPFRSKRKMVGYYADDFDIARAVHHAVGQGVKIINLSLGGEGIAPVLDYAIQDAIGRGVVVFAAAGNEHNNDLSRISPAGIDGVVPVVATDTADRLTGFSNFGSLDALAAPGFGIYSTTPTYKPKYGHAMKQGYDYLDGTSMASPVAAGCAALVASHMLTEVREFFQTRKPGLKVTVADLPQEEIVNALAYSAVDLGAWDRDRQYGYGRVRPLAALKRISDPDQIKLIANKVYRRILARTGK